MVYEIKCNDNVIYRIYASDEYIQYTMTSSTGTTLHDRKYYWEYENYCRYGKVLTNELASYITIPSSASSYVSQIIGYWCVAKKTDATLSFLITVANGSTDIPITNDYEILDIDIYGIIETALPWTQNSGAWNLHVQPTSDICTYGNSSTTGNSYMRAAVVPCYIYAANNTENTFRVRADFLGGIYNNDALVDQTHLKALTLMINVPLY